MMLDISGALRRSRVLPDASADAFDRIARDMQTRLRGGSDGGGGGGSGGGGAAGSGGDGRDGDDDVPAVMSGAGEAAAMDTTEQKPHEQCV